MMMRWINSHVGDIITWLWTWTQLLSYWVTLIGGTCCIIVYMVTKDRKFLTFTGAALIIYVMIVATGHIV